MKYLSFLATLIIFTTPALSQYNAYFNPLNTAPYDDPVFPTSTVRCSQYLANKGYRTFADIPTFPNIGGFVNMTDATCGTCWKMTRVGGNETLVVAMIDGIGEGSPNTVTFDLSHSTMVSLGSYAIDLAVNAKQVKPSFCGL
ncbi:hypothetical protein SERLA73DRAFT_76293 [Serpula lacrymans var. lacrymans S7.3]|uniref:Cerato-platanin n=2 Tax=Serpula lacrymans var. lacrymans TaxID=341189 RepID=F8Q6S7_SERL3|nr:uncharacterized protein SERLADRAFT_441085 [Serpula lacrymans var. lacrymans S7.9]EGN96315.1 hypothetical protein SERLA73DRAFT_76293 [Serpula lacrymans var. lacrymans S7.3]EGO21852.1 hypothetical protein SERLADRAFT_441085 [Serpula lacrymans var. lacrymans S7.9]